MKGIRQVKTRSGTRGRKVRPVCTPGSENRWIYLAGGLAMLLCSMNPVIAQYASSESLQEIDVLADRLHNVRQNFRMVGTLSSAMANSITLQRSHGREFCRRKTGRRACNRFQVHARWRGQHPINRRAWRGQVQWDFVEALARLDGILESLREVRDATQSRETLESALENSVSRYSCARMGVLGMLTPAVGLNLAAGVEADIALAIPMPNGALTNYGFDIGIPLTLSAGVSGDMSAGFDVYTGFENWNCWRNELPFPSPRVYDIGDYETPYTVYSGVDASASYQTAKLDHTSAQTDNTQSFDTQSLSGGVDEAARMAVEVINGLMDLLREIGLDPADPYVVSKILSLGADEAILRFQELAAPDETQTLAEQAVRAPGLVMELLSESSPGADLVEVASSVMGQGNWLEATDPCQLIPGIESSCNMVLDVGSNLLDAVLLLSDFECLYSGGSNALQSVSESLSTVLDSGNEQMTTVVETFEPMKSAAQDIQQGLEVVESTGPGGVISTLGSYIGTTMDALEEIVSIMDEVSDALTTEFTWQEQEFFSFHFATVRCVGNVKVTPNIIWSPDMSISCTVL